MKHIDEEEDPNDAKVDHVVPEVLDKFDAHTRAIKVVREDITRDGEKNRRAEVNPVAKLKVELNIEVAKVASVSLKNFAAVMGKSLTDYS